MRRVLLRALLIRGPIGAITAVIITHFTGGSYVGIFVGTFVAIYVGGWVADVITRGSRGRRGLFSMKARHGAGRGEARAAGGPAAGAGWRAMRVAARLMPPAAGRRWLAEAASFLAEAPPALRHGAVRSYLIGAPRVIAVSWAGYLAGKARLTGSGPAPR